MSGIRVSEVVVVVVVVVVNFVKHLKTFTGLAEIAKSKGLGENPEVTIAKSCSFIIPSCNRLFPFLQEPLKGLCPGILSYFDHRQTYL